MITTGCVTLPDVYVVDRHTVMESEASGEWPALEERLKTLALKKGVEPIDTELSVEAEEGAFKMLNSEFPNR